MHALHEARFYETVEGGVVCRLCPHACRIADGGRGRCQARVAHGHKLYAVGYGAASSLALDPIEKKPLYHFHPGSHILSYGSFGCNMACRFCQNASISTAAPEQAEGFLPPAELARAALSCAAKSVGVAFTYNEPLINIEYYLDCAALLREAGQKTVLVTNGMISAEAFAEILPLTDAMNIDLKSFNPDFYKRHGGDLMTVKQNILTAAGGGGGDAVRAGSPPVHVEVTTLVIPGENDSPEEMRAQAAWLAEISPEIPLHLSRFFPRHRMMGGAPTPRVTLEALAKIAREYLLHVYLGNV
jgi:pyruvate formate lyase activating enzyme